MMIPDPNPMPGHVYVPEHVWNDMCRRLGVRPSHHYAGLHQAICRLTEDDPTYVEEPVVPMGEIPDLPPLSYLRGNP